jgi:hypothetical protein
MGEGAGYSKGYSAGYEEGIDTDAYQEGYDAGEAAGYEEGYTAGEADGFVAFSEYIRFKGTLDNLFAKNDVNNQLITNEQLKKMLTYNIKDYCTNKKSASHMFVNQRLITEIPEFDISGVTNLINLFGSAVNNSNASVFNNGGHPPLLDTSSAGNINFMFAGALCNDSFAYNNMTVVPLYDFRKVNSANGLFFKCKEIKEIPAFNFLILSEYSYSFNYANTDSTSDWLKGCSNLEKIHIVDIHYNFNISQSEVTKLDRGALVEIIGNLRDMTGSTAKTLKMGSTNMAKLTDEDIAVATAKNWTIA